MTDPLLWLDGDPTDGRRARPHEPAPEARTEPLPPLPAQDEPPRRRGLFSAALAGGLVSAVLVGGGAFAFGLVDTSSNAAAPTPGPALVGAKQTGDVAAIYAAARNSVVSIKTSEGSGTGFVVKADGTIVTNAHVVGTESTVQVQFADDETVQGTVGGVDRSSDLAVVKVSTSRTLKPLALADSATVRTGQLAVAIGSPFGLSQTTTAGIVSGTGRHIQAPDGFQIDSVIQTDAPINPGNSGGPLLDATGRVIGVNSQIASQSGGSVGIGFAVPSNTVRDVIPRLEKGEQIKRAYLGVSTSADSGKVTIAAVSAGGPAASAGLQVGDVLTAVGGKSVATPDDVAAAIQDKHPGESVAVQITRGGSAQTLNVTLAERPSTATP
ncbi:trypsin-like peptidase domain-containing protein [Solirubrobacter ginsenosidimutans]|uniref:Trypsin-like peptidase domain-containing protein n=1 Tax=Solirubrobacter ginsenosidimutans TaxID=490573 RepID=A0A9X3MQS6_9ACTN|nr:trypsin-like peptidase domain-containing protein [Solirubrobacter ginsenosidimutans]MDA0160151.1 trypsin-like peptidase domain-containing protein [Solirubrobacter ginsenosidimutans]